MSKKIYKEETNKDIENIVKDNINTVEKKIAEYKEDKKYFSDGINRDIAFYILFLLIGASVGIYAIKTLAIYSLIFLPVVLVPGAIFTNLLVGRIKERKIESSIYKKRKKEAEKIIKKEKSKLKGLELNNKGVQVEQTIQMSTDKTKMIKELEKKASLIRDYMNNQKEFLLDYKNNNLSELSVKHKYSKEDIEFIKTLIEEELGVKKINSNEEVSHRRKK